MNEVVLIMIEAHDGFAVNWEEAIKNVVPYIASNHEGKDICLVLFSDKVIDYNRVEEHYVDDWDYVEEAINSFEMEDSNDVSIDKVCKKLKKKYLYNNDIVTDVYIMMENIDETYTDIIKKYFPNTKVDYDNLEDEDEDDCFEENSTEKYVFVPKTNIIKSVIVDGKEGILILKKDID